MYYVTSVFITVDCSHSVLFLSVYPLNVMFPHSVCLFCLPLYSQAAYCTHLLAVVEDRMTYLILT